MTKYLHQVLTILLISVCYVTLYAQELKLKTTLDNRVSETSGLLYLNNTIITHNDSGGEPELYEINQNTGEVSRIVKVNNAENVDWEDICNDDTYIYIGDFGNNNGTRTDLKIYRILIGDYLQNEEVDAEIINFNYADQTSFTTNQLTNYDAEALISYGEQLFIFTKNWSSYYSTNVYTVSKIPGDYSINRLTSIETGGLISGATCDAESSTIVLVGYGYSVSLIGATIDNGCIMVIDGFDDLDFTNWNINNYTPAISDDISVQVEGITYVDESKLLVSSESYKGTNSTLCEFDMSGGWLETDTSGDEDSVVKGSNGISIYSFYQTVYISVSEEWLLSSDKVIAVYNVAGQFIHQIKLSDEETSFDLPYTGVYIIKVVSGEKTYQQKVLIND